MSTFVPNGETELQILLKRLLLVLMNQFNVFVSLNKRELGTYQE